MKKAALKVIGILILGAIGGIISQIFLVPYLMQIPIFGESEIFKNLKREIIINPTKEIVIKESGALEKVVEQVAPAVLNLSFGSPVPERQDNACGFSLTSDGQVLTRASFLATLTPKKSGNFILVDGQETNFQVLKKDLKLDLALIKIEKSNLKTIPFFDFEKLKVGTSVFLIGTGEVVNQGIVRTLAKDNLHLGTVLIGTNIIEKENFSGCPLFTLEGKFLGLVKTNKVGEVFAIPVTKIRSFTGL